MNNCLAYKILDAQDDLLGEAIVSRVVSFLIGAEIRAIQTEEELDLYRVWGAFDDPDFYQSLLDFSEFRASSLRWASSHDLVELTFMRGVDEMRSRALKWEESGNATKSRKCVIFTPEQVRSELFWKHFSSSLFLYEGLLGKFSGKKFHSFLKGITLGGDWLDLPAFTRNTEIVDAIYSKSHEKYDDTTEIFRHHNASDILEIIGIKQESPKEGRTSGCT